MAKIKKFKEFFDDTDNEPTIKPWYKKKGVIPALITAIAIILAAIIGIYPFISSNKQVDKPQNDSLLTIEKMAKSDTGTNDKKFASTIITIPLTDYKQKDSILTKIRNEKKLRRLTALESGKKLIFVPNKTFLYLYVFYLEVNSGRETYTSILNSKVNRFKKSDSYYEMYKINNDELYLCGFVSQEVASYFPQLIGGKDYEFILTSFPRNKNDNIALIPIVRIINSDVREIDLDKNHQFMLLDIRIK